MNPASIPLPRRLVPRRLRTTADRSPRRALEVRQVGDSLTATVTLAAGIAAEGLWLSFGGDQWVELETSVRTLPTAPVGPDGRQTVRCEITLNLASVHERVAAAVKGLPAPLPQTAPVDDADSTARTWDECVLDGSWDNRSTLYLQVSSPGTAVMGGARFDDGADHDPTSDERVSYRVTFGRYRHTRLEGLREVRAGQGSLTPYPNRRGVLGLRLNASVDPYQRVIVSRLRVRQGILELRGEVRTRHTRVSSTELVLTARGSDGSWASPVRLVEDDAWRSEHFGHGRYEFSTTFDFGKLLTADLPADQILDAWLVSAAVDAEDRHWARIGRTPFLERQLSNTDGVRGPEQSLLVVPYYTMKAKNTSFRIERFSTDAYDLLRGALRRPAVSYAPGHGRRIWIVGEQPDRAQDTGLAFFRHLRQNHPEIDAYYVIDRTAPEARNLDGLDHVVDYRSPEHIDLTLRAERIVGSHHPEYLYPSRSRAFAQLVRARHVFLQHGVIAMKWMAQTYGKDVPSFRTDLFVVSSEREKQFIVHDLGYDPQSVVVTGLARFDTLLDGKTPARPNQVLIMPTWRDWMHTTSQFLESEYFAAWHGLLRDPAFRAVVEENNLDVVLSLHPNMQPYLEHFADVPARIVLQGEVDVQHLIKESAVLVTDYSSVAWDFSFLHKPVLFYQFDRARMFSRTRPHMDMESELPGPASASGPELVAELAAACARGLAMEAEFVERADKFIAHRDTHNAERIFEAVEPAGRPLVPGQAVVTKELRTTGVKVFRKSRFYHPVMRRFYKLLSLLPPDPGIVFFESGLARQMNDSPRAIYDELVRRNDPRLRVWSYRGRVFLPDENSRVVKPYSPSYFWYLGRAKYWVSNQNLPYYITRGRQRVYLQTWHGTPLKKMASDVEEIHGRDAGYLDRVTTAAAQWSVLLSPSPYATRVIRSSYAYDGPALEVGYPRNDVLMGPDREETAARVRSELGIAASAKTVLYAPTFRDDQSVGGGRFSFELPFSLAEFHDRLGDDVVLILRMHVLVAGKIDIPEELREHVVDASSYPDIQELYLASDLLVTDYSSVFFDYSLLRRPMVFFAYDLERYSESLRGFYLDYEATAPGRIETTQEGFLDAVESGLREGVADEDRLDEFVRTYNPHDDGHATERAVEIVLAHEPAPTAGGRLRGWLGRISGALGSRSR